MSLLSVLSGKQTFRSFIHIYLGNTGFSLGGGKTGFAGLEELEDVIGLHGRHVELVLVVQVLNRDGGHIGAAEVLTLSLGLDSGVSHYFEWWLREWGGGVESGKGGGEEGDCVHKEGCDDEGVERVKIGKNCSM